ncbi:MAG: phage head closure protein [Actinomycetota bacterium]
MRAGQLRHKIVIQQVLLSQDAYGASVETLSTFATVWTSIEPISGREYFDSAKLNAEITHRIRIRYTAGITPDMKVLFGSRTFDILSIIDREERNREMELMCAEVVK